MKNAAETSFDYDDEEGSADNAAVLGPDGGPLNVSSGKEVTVLEDDFDDEEWLDEELSDEELAALGEEDFEAALLEDFSGDGGEDFEEGDLEDFDELDDFDLLDNSSDGATAGLDLDDVEHETPEEGFPEDIDDSLFDLKDEDSVVIAQPAPDISAAFTDQPMQDEPVQDTIQTLQGDDFVEEEVESEDTDINFADDEFSIDDDFTDSENGEEIHSAAIVTVSPKDVEARQEGEVVPTKDPETTGEDLDFSDYDEDDSFAELDDTETFHRPVPRISIHAFCETSRNSAILEKAAVDRRLMKAHFTMHMGGIAKAVDIYQTNSTPNLIIIETVIGGMDLIHQLGQLAEVCDPSTKVVLIGRVNDIRLYRELIRQGISEYIVRPKSPLQIIKTISELYVDPSAPPIGKTIAFVGTRGGVGSSTIAHNVGWSIAEEFQSDTVILDLDLPFGTTALDLGHEPTSGLMEALTSPERLDDVLLERLLQKHTDHLSLFTSPNMLDRDYNFDDEAFETVIDVVKSAAPTVVIDVPHNWTGWSKKILQTADEIVITATPDFASFRNMKYLIEIISSARPNDSRPHFVYNQFDPKTSAVPVEYFVENVDLEPSLVLGWEPQLFNAAATNAAPILEVSPKYRVAQGLNELAGKILGRTQTLALPSRFSLTNLFKRN